MPGHNMPAWRAGLGMISIQQVDAVSHWLLANKGNAGIEQPLRATFPDMHFTFCFDDDVMSDNPAAELPGYRLYLVDSSNHCLCLTTEPEQASGVVVAELEVD